MEKVSLPYLLFALYHTVLLPKMQERGELGGKDFAHKRGKHWKNRKEYVRMAMDQEQYDEFVEPYKQING